MNTLDSLFLCMHLRSYEGPGYTQEDELGVHFTTVPNYKHIRCNVGKNEITKRVLDPYIQGPMPCFSLPF